MGIRAIRRQSARQVRAVKIVAITLKTRTVVGSGEGGEAPAYEKTRRSELHRGREIGEEAKMRR